MSEQQSTGKARMKKPYVTPTIRTLPATSTLVKAFFERKQEWKRRRNDEQEDNTVRIN